MRRRLTFEVVLLLLAVVKTAYAHEVRPGYLELRQTDAGMYAVLWKVPAVGDMRLSIHPRFPE
ncbi:MAG TPA: HupE/UreJ family protein, partial [Candidatus Eisenbacteria bacterium]|nr:HupE/UreJ family protein [Candidatus Eisenbacteria bacterium]